MLKIENVPYLTPFVAVNREFRTDYEYYNGQLININQRSDGYHLFTDNPRQITEIAIELVGLGHTDYFYDPANPGDNPELKQKASRFIAEVTWRSKDILLLERFFLDNGIDRDSKTGRYIVDLDEVVYL